MLAHMIAMNQTRSEHERVLILTNTARSKDAERLIFKKTWSLVTRIPTKGHWRATAKIRELTSWRKEQLDRYRPRSIEWFLANDTDWTHQWVMSQLGQGHINLFEDGMASYINNRGMNPWPKVLFRKLFYRAILGKHYTNPHGIGQTPASDYWALSKDAFPQIQNRQKIKLITINHAYQAYLNQAIPPNLINSDIFNDGLILTQPLHEYGLASSNDEITIYTELGKAVAKTGCRIVYVKKHPAEKPELFLERQRIIREQSGLPIQQLSDPTPIETYFLGGIRFLCIASITSSAIINASHMRAAPHIFSAFDALPPRSRKKQADCRKTLVGSGIQVIAKPRSMQT